MKKIILKIILFLILGFNFAFAQNTMRIDTLSGKPGDTLTFSVKIDNVKTFVAYQLDIQLPAQLSYVNNSAALTSRANGHSFAVSLINPTLVRVLAYSMIMSPFLGNTGPVLTFKCIAGTVPGNYNLNVVSPVISDSLNANILTASYNGKFTLLLQKISFNTSSIDFGRTLLGTNADYNLYIYNNGTSNLTVSRLSSLSTDIRFLDSSGAVISAGGNIMRTVRMYASTRGAKTASLIIYSNDPTDSVHIIPAQGTVYTTNELYLNTISLKYGFSGSIKIRMKNTVPVNAFQTTITLPSSVQYNMGSIILNPLRKDDHVITASLQSGNVLKIISYSPTNKPYLGSDSTIAEFTIRAIGSSGSYGIPINEGIISDTLGVNVMSNVYSGNVSITSPVISLPASIAFDTISYIDTNRKVLAIRNNGNDTLLISGINCANTSFVNETTLPVKIPPSTTNNFTIRFSNPNRGWQTGNLIISHNDSLRNPGIVPVTGYVYKINKVLVRQSEFNSRDSSYVSFDINNSESIVAFQFDVTLPSQASFVPNSAMLTSRANGHSVYTSVLGNGDIRVVAFSMTQSPFFGSSGEIVKFKSVISADTGYYAVTIKNVIISDSNNVNIASGFTNGFIRVSPYPPVLLSPGNGSVGNELNLNLIWSSSRFASGYHLQLATDSLFTNKVVNDSTRTDTTYSLTNLNILQNYYWRVRVKNYSGIYRFSNYSKFKTIGYPSQVILASPANNAVNQPLNMTFTWYKAFDQTLSPKLISKYWFELATDSLFTGIISRDTILSDTTKIVSGLSNIASYYWRVKAKNQIGWDGFSEIRKFTTLPPVPAAPVLLLPANNSTGNPLSLSLVWNKPQYATGYNVVLATDAGFSNIILNDSTLTDSVKTITNLNPLTTYYWKVRAYNLAGWGVFSGTFNFKTIGTPTTVILSSPANNAVNQPVNLNFSWYKAIDQTAGPKIVSNYWFELSTDSSFAAIITRDSILTDTTKSVSGLSNFTNYFWRVKAKNQIGWAAFSSIWKFTTIVPVPGAPSLMSPSNNSTGNPLNLNLVWNKPLYAVNFNIVLATDAGFTNIILNDSTLTDSVKALTNLNTLTTYFWKVRAKNIAGWGAFSVTYNFKTIGIPTTVVLAAPANNAVNQPVNLTFSWYKAIDQTMMSLKTGNKGKIQNDEPLAVTTYWFEITADSTFATILIRDSVLADTTKIIAGLSNNTKYYWRVKAYNQIGWGAFSVPWHFTTIVPVPNAPVLISPINNSTSIPLTPTLIWNSVNYAESYRIQVSSDSTFATTQWDTIFVSGMSNTVPAGRLSNLTKYFWRICAINIAGIGPYSPVWSFTTIVALPAAPTLLSPANGSTGISLTPTLTWNSVTNAVSYHIQVSADSLFATTQWDTVVVSLTSNTVPSGKLSQNTKYYWRVNASNAGGTGAWSTVWNFRTLTLNLQLNLKAYLEGFWDGTSQVTDTVRIYLANATSPFAFVDTVVVVLSTSGTANIQFTKAASGSYYIVVAHRNHLQTWSKLPQTFVGGTPLNYDFTTSATQAYGDNMKQVGSVWVFYGGDANLDGSIDGMDIVLFVPQFGTQGYLSCDFNGDEDVNASDVFIITANYGLTIATPTLAFNFNPPVKKPIDVKDVMKKVNSNKENVKSNGNGSMKKTGNENVKK